MKGNFFFAAFFVGIISEQVFVQGSKEEDAILSAQAFELHKNELRQGKDPSDAIPAAFAASGLAVGMGLGLAAPIFAVGAGVAYFLRTSTEITIGQKAENISAVSHANVIALHDQSNNRFIRLLQDTVDGGNKTRALDNKLPLEWYFEQFLVFHVDGAHCAFYGLAHGRYIRMSKDGAVYPGPFKPLTSPIEPDEIFQVMDRQDGKISLFSPTNSRYIRITDNAGSVRGELHHSELQVVLLWTGPNNIRIVCSPTSCGF